MTPTPWHVGKKYQTDVYSKSKTILGGTLVARSTIDDAAHIVKCVNAYDDLLAALQALLNYPEGQYSTTPGFDEAYARAESAIAKATS